MTTINNFLHSNFIDNPDNTDIEVSQNPIWVLSSQKSFVLNQAILRQYIINHALQTVKYFQFVVRPLIHIDFGVNLTKKYPSIQFKNTELQNGLIVCQPFQYKPYFIIRTPILLRKESNFMTKLATQINQLNKSKILKKFMNQCNLAKKYQEKYCLLIQNIESMLVLNKAKQVESFINKLSNLDQSFKQVSIFIQEKLINNELMFCLQRISTCLTILTSWNSIESTWQCTSTVRRYTGYSNEEYYLLTIQKQSQKIIVVKKLNVIDSTKETKQQQQMVKSLGFFVKKQKDKQQTDLLKKMIYPHLKIQQKQCQCHKTECQTCSKEALNPDDGLIILDDEQQDEDDVDV